jgi:hypothetical protein
MGPSTLWYWFIPAAMALTGLAFVVLRIARREDPKKQITQARGIFQQERNRLETLFFQTASSSGKPRGLRWTECQWSELIAWVRHRQTGQLMALVGVTISFEAIEGGDMEGLEAVGNLRNASAVFFYQNGQWQTGGRVIFNLNPDEAVEHFKQGYERID